ncbi:alpha/beta fold hydrolase [Taibaiella chishuiensis]|uniref:Pimeloyl-ACP methyl ester carboxylesterase n=1 Tax=Taibaiella chishuiensis TaxID=1434707 RepID=A0A2P8CXT6_9BACT|nr:alpha/beta hydrolase [Taibaiella chishuiensis]PSK89778.1 pimeloyl-ACP methyl ester carboxylesterase [Taibaiella chishuiensis]
MKKIKTRWIQAAATLKARPGGHKQGRIYKAARTTGSIVSTLLLLCLFAIPVAGQTPQDYYDTLQIGGIRQVIRVQGKAGAPLLLFLHGGPGSSRMAQADKFSKQLQEHFTVVQWDQRETGRTLQCNTTKGPITLAMMEQDTEALVDTLLHRFAQEKLYLAGESWGTVPGFYMAGRHPDKLHAYLAFSPVIDQLKSERMLIVLLQDYALMAHNKEAQRELLSVKIPFREARDLYYSRKWLFTYNDEPIADKDTAVMKSYLETWSATWLPVWNAALQRNLLKTLPEIKCPVYFFIGGKDLQTNCTIAKSYYESLKAPAKALFWYKDAGHSLLVTEAPEVQRTIIEKILRQ